MLAVGKEVRIGDPDRYVDGRQVYVIRYAVENANVPFPEHNELYWNVTGNDGPPGTDGRTFHSFTRRIARERTPMYTALTHVPNQ